jgi:hypothetical protein
MGGSIYYSARRNQPLTRSEATLVRIIVRTGSVDSKIEKYLATGEGLNWESFCLYEKYASPDLVLEGATRLPDNAKDAIDEGAKHWCTVLTLLRLAISDADWIVNIEDCPITWNAKEKRYDPYA